MHKMSSTAHPPSAGVLDPHKEAEALRLVDALESLVGVQRSLSLRQNTIAAQLLSSSAAAAAVSPLPPAAVAPPPPAAPPVAAGLVCPSRTVLLRDDPQASTTPSNRVALPQDLLRHMQQLAGLGRGGDDDRSSSTIDAAAAAAAAAAKTPRARARARSRPEWNGSVRGAGVAGGGSSHGRSSSSSSGGRVEEVRRIRETLRTPWTSQAAQHTRRVPRRPAAAAAAAGTAREEAQEMNQVIDRLLGTHARFAVATKDGKARAGPRRPARGADSVTSDTSTRTTPAAGPSTPASAHGGPVLKTLSALASSGDATLLKELASLPKGAFTAILSPATLHAAGPQLLASPEAAPAAYSSADNPVIVGHRGPDPLRLPEAAGVVQTISARVNNSDASLLQELATLPRGAFNSVVVPAVAKPVAVGGGGRDASMSHNTTASSSSTSSSSVLQSPSSSSSSSSSTVSTSSL